MKRKYTRKAIQSKSDRTESSNSDKLPPEILNSIEKIVEHRKSLGLFDDREERIERAIRYQEFIRGKHG